MVTKRLHLVLVSTFFIILAGLLPVSASADVTLGDPEVEPTTGFERYGEVIKLMARIEKKYGKKPKVSAKNRWVCWTADDDASAEAKLNTHLDRRSGESITSIDSKGQPYINHLGLLTKLRVEEKGDKVCVYVEIGESFQATRHKRKGIFQAILIPGARVYCDDSKTSFEAATGKGVVAVVGLLGKFDLNVGVIKGTAKDSDGNKFCGIIYEDAAKIGSNQQPVNW